MTTRESSKLEASEGYARSEFKDGMRQNDIIDGQKLIDPITCALVPSPVQREVAVI